MNNISVKTRKKWLVINEKPLRGLTLPQVMFHDPNKFFYLYNTGRIPSYLQNEADEINRKSQTIIIPSFSVKQTPSVLVYRNTKSGFYNGCKLVRNQKIYFLRRHGEFQQCLSLKMAYSLSPCDRVGARRMLGDIKMILFGKESCRMSRQFCEEFFDDENNFTAPDKANLLYHHRYIEYLRSICHAISNHCPSGWINREERIEEAGISKRIPV